MLRTWAFAVVLGACGQSLAGEHGHPGPGRAHILRRIQPVGGWHPDGGGLWHWWDPHCFPRCGGPDDYCRKPAPKVCRPNYPPFYIWTPSSGGR